MSLPSFSARARASVSVAIILFLWLAIYVAGMFTPALLDDVDTIHAEAAREMVLRHDWVTLYTDGIRYLEKAPLMYWGVAASYKIFGISDWSTRLPLMLGVLATLLSAYWVAKMGYGERGGRYAAIVLATSLGPFIFTRFEIPDIMVALWLTLGAGFFLLSLRQEKPSRWVCWGFAATCALNVLTKSLIGLVFPFGAIFIYLLLTGNLRHILKLRLFSSTIVFLAIAAPWHILAALRNPTQMTSNGTVKGFLWFYFVNEQFKRYLGTRIPAGTYDTVPLLIFWALTILWVAPWLIFLPQSVAQLPKRQQWRQGLNPAQQTTLFCVIWALVILIFFSFSTRQEYYTIPVVPALAIVIGAWLAKEADAPEQESRWAMISSWVWFAVVIGGSILGIVLLISSKTPAPGADLADLLKKNPQDYNFSLGHFLDLTPEALGMFRPQLFGAVASLLIGASLNLWLRYKRKPEYGNAILAGMMVALLACVHSAFVVFSPILSSKPLAVAIKKHLRPGDVVVIDGQYHEASTLNFYLQERVRVLDISSGSLWYGVKFPDAPRVYETQASFAQLWDSPTPVFLWTDKDEPKELAGLPHYLLARSGGKAIYTNREPAH